MTIFEKSNYLDDELIIIPSGRTEVSSEEFSGNTKVRHVIIPEGVAVIEESAFEGCSSLEKVQLPDSLTKIEDAAFCGCSSLRNAKLPDTLTYIGCHAFLGCSSLRNVILPDSLTYIGNYAFSDCSSLESITIPSGVSDLGYYGMSTLVDGWIFQGCINLSEVILSEGVESIGNCVFEGCRSLKSLVLPTSLKEIISFAFNGCSSLESLTLPENVNRIGDMAFAKCVSLKNVSFLGSTSIGQGAFDGCSGLESVIFTKSEEVFISAGAFADCKALSKVYHPNNLIHWGGKGIFQNCRPDIETCWGNLSKVDGLILDGDKWSKINSCLDCKSITIPKSVSFLGQNLYELKGSWGNDWNTIQGTDSLDEVVVPSHVREIGVFAFTKCDGLKTLSILGPKTKICGSALKECKGLETIYVPKGFKDVFIDTLKGGYLNSLESLVKEMPDTEDCQALSNEASDEYKEKKSKSYVVIECTEDAIPQFNKLQFRTYPPSFVELHPGKNVLTVEDYPALKYGFSQIDNCDLEGTDTPDDYLCQYNCGSVIGVDLSHFDASAVTDMSNMFSRMEDLRTIDFGNIQMKNIHSADYTFEWVGMGIGKNRPHAILNLQNINMSEVESTEDMFYCCNFKTVDLSGWDLSKVTDADEMFLNSSIDNLILDNAKFSEEVLDELIRSIEEEDGDYKSISMKGCDRNLIRKIAIAVNASNRNTAIILDDNLDYRVSTNSYGTKKCLIINTCSASKNKSLYDIKGTVLNKFLNKKKAIACIPFGVTEIAPSAFEGLESLHYVILPSTVRKIGSNAFKGCSNLRGIHLPDHESSYPGYEAAEVIMGNGIFSGCTNLRHLYVPNFVKRLGSLGNCELDYLRIPLSMVEAGCLSRDTRIKHLMLAIPNNTPHRDASGEGLCVKSDVYRDEKWWEYAPYISFESFKTTVFPFGESCAINGVLIGSSYEPEDEYEDFLMAGAFMVPSTTLAIPIGVQRLESMSIGYRFGPLLIPDTIRSIDEEAFAYTPGYKYPILVTKEDNYPKLKDILPISLGTIRIILI